VGVRVLILWKKKQKGRSDRVKNHDPFQLPMIDEGRRSFKSEGNNLSYGTRSFSHYHGRFDGREIDKIRRKD
jgi:hypothetical protein